MSPRHLAFSLRASGGADGRAEMAPAVIRVECIMGKAGNQGRVLVQYIGDTTPSMMFRATGNRQRGAANP
jgi:hypothetical protein